MDEGEVTVLQPASNDENLKYMTDLSLNTPMFCPFDVDKLIFNDQGTSLWYKKKYPGFPDFYYDILELYSLNDIRAKQFKTHLKKLKKNRRTSNVCHPYMRTIIL